MLAVNSFIFDFGGVLYRNPDVQWMRRWQKFLGLSGDPFVNAFLDSPEESKLMKDMVLGKISEDEIWRMAAEQYHMAPAILNRIRKAIISKKRVNSDVVNFVKGLKPRFKTAILSNASDSARQIFEQLGLDRVMDVIIISAEEGLAKPDERIYLLALERLGVRPDQAVFLDDRLDNIAAAQKLGMKAVQFINTHQALSAMKIYTQG
jgi:epoxide hydrolase-like predicted phosphatase